MLFNMHHLYLCCVYGWVWRWGRNGMSSPFGCFQFFPSDCPIWFLQGYRDRNVSVRYCVFHFHFALLASSWSFPCIVFTTNDIHICSICRLPTGELRFSIVGHFTDKNTIGMCVCVFVRVDLGIVVWCNLVWYRELRGELGKCLITFWYNIIIFCCILLGFRFFIVCVCVCKWQEQRRLSFTFHIFNLFAIILE